MSTGAGHAEGVRGVSHSWSWRAQHCQASRRRWTAVGPRKPPKALRGLRKGGTSHLASCGGCGEAADSR
eukprot:1730319-Alexandrium_andersonii.AAC.1